MLKDSIESLREDYKKNKLDKKDLQADPFVQFGNGLKRQGKQVCTNRMP